MDQCWGRHDKQRCPVFTLLCSQISAGFIITAYLIFYCILHLYSPTHTWFFFFQILAFIHLFIQYSLNVSYEPGTTLTYQGFCCEKGIAIFLGNSLQRPRTQTVQVSEASSVDCSRDVEDSLTLTKASLSMVLKFSLLSNTESPTGYQWEAAAGSREVAVSHLKYRGVSMMQLLEEFKSHRQTWGQQKDRSSGAQAALSQLSTVGPESSLSPLKKASVNANQNYNVVPPQTGQNGHHQKIHK